MKKEEYFALHLEDYALPGFVSGEKTYYGTLSDINNFISALQNKCGDCEFHMQTVKAYKQFIDGNKDVTHTVAYNKRTLMNSVKLLGEKSFGIANDIKWAHINIYGYPYYMKADSCIVSHIWLFDGERYMRCVKPSFENLSYSVLEDGDYSPISMLWGYPEIVFFDDTSKTDFISSRLFLFERNFNSEKEIRQDIQAFVGDGNYTEFCNEIFADG